MRQQQGQLEWDKKCVEQIEQSFSRLREKKDPCPKQFV